VKRTRRISDVGRPGCAVKWLGSILCAMSAVYLTLRQRNILPRSLPALLALSVRALPRVPIARIKTH
jgi:hypothetical protein